MSIGAVWGSLSSTWKALYVIFLIVNVGLLAAIGATLGVIYTNTGSSDGDTISCPDGWTVHNGFCYKAFHSEDPFTMSQVACTEEEGSLLVSIHSQDENDFVQSLLIANDGWLNGVQNPPHWIWVDGSAWDYENWAVDEPLAGNTYLKMSEGGKWVAANIDETAQEYVCKINIDAMTTTTAEATTATEAPIGCDDWTEHAGHCYQVITQIMSFDDASAACKAEDAELTSITTEAENQFVSGLLEGVDGWLGGKLVSADWTWLDGTPWVDSTTFWDPDTLEPVGDNYCMKMKVDTSTWITALIAVDSTADKYVCKKVKPTTTTTTLAETTPTTPIDETTPTTPIDETTPTTTIPETTPTTPIPETTPTTPIPETTPTTPIPETTPTTPIPETTPTTPTIIGCETGWEEYENYCYQAFVTSISFAEAETACKSEAADLTSILTEGENTFVSTLLDSVDGWLGAKLESTVWTWVDGTAWDETLGTASAFWDMNEPIAENNFMMMNVATSKWITATIDPVVTAEKYVCKKVKPTTKTWA